MKAGENKMIYICYKQGSGSWTKFEVQELESEKEAITWIKDLPKSRVVGVFSGKRLEPELGEKRIIKKAIVGFAEHKKEEEE